MAPPRTPVSCGRSPAIAGTGGNDGDTNTAACSRAGAEQWQSSPAVHAAHGSAGPASRVTCAEAA